MVNAGCGHHFCKRWWEWSKVGVVTVSVGAKTSLVYMQDFNTVSRVETSIHHHEFYDKGFAWNDVTYTLHHPGVMTFALHR